MAKTDYIKLLKKYYIGIIIGAVLGLWFFKSYEKPILMSVQNMALIPDIEVAGAGVTGLIEGVFSFAGAAAAVVLQKLGFKK